MRPASLRERYYVQSEPRDRTYEQLLGAALSACEQFLFVDLPEPHFREEDTAFGPRARGVADQLRGHLIAIDRTKAWPATTLGDYGPNVEPFARVHRYRLNAFSVEILSRSARGLYEWTPPELPLDLCLMRGDNDPWLVNIALHEEAFLNLTSPEVVSRRSRRRFSVRLQRMPS